MFAVLFDVLPRSCQWDAYLGLARLLKPDLEQICQPLRARVRY